MSHGLFPDEGKPEPRRAGVLASQEIKELIRNGKLRSTVDVTADQIQPASIDLRLGTIAYQVEASFLPSRSSLVSAKIRDLKKAELDLTKPAELKTDAVYVIPIIESLALPKDISAKANPKSTTGRLDIFTRLMTDAGESFDEVPAGYSGDLYLEVYTRTFPVVVKAGSKLNQVRFVRGEAEIDDVDLQRIADKLVYFPDDEAESTKPNIKGGLRISVDLRGDNRNTVVAYRAKRKCPAIDLSKVGAYDPAKYWEPTYSTEKLVLKPGDFYLLASNEGVGVPPKYAAEMEQYDSSIGEFSVHYAGFFDPGFGFGASGEIKGTKAVLEVRAHELPVLLENRQPVGRIRYYRMSNIPEKIYGQAIGSSYQQQGLALSKQFRSTPVASELAATGS